MTFNVEQLKYINRQLNVARVIFLGLTSGVVIFTTFTLILNSVEQELAPGQAVEAEPRLEDKATANTNALANDESTTDVQPILTYLAAGSALVAAVLSVVVPGLIGSVRQKLVDGEPYPWPNEQLAPPPEVGDVGPLVAHGLLRMIVGWAILEGAAFFNLVAYFIERQPLSLIMTALLLVVMLLKFPTRGRMEEWLQGELRTIEELRSLRTQPLHAR